jgi:hypothetical protein
VAVLLAKIQKKEGTPMTVEPIDQVIRLWETGQITPEQAIGKLLLWLQQLHHRLLKMDPGLHWLQLETVAYFVGQLKRVDCLSLRLWPKRGGIPPQKGFVETGITL